MPLTEFEHQLAVELLGEALSEAALEAFEKANLSTRDVAEDLTGHAFSPAAVRMVEKAVSGGEQSVRNAVLLARAVFVAGYSLTVSLEPVRPADAHTGAAPAEGTWPDWG